MKRIIFTALIALLFSGVYLAKSYAETALFFAPTRVEIKESKPVEEIRVTNMSDIARSYRVNLENVVMGEDGITSRVDNFDYSAKRMIRYVPRKFDLQPGERQIIRIMARYPEGTEDGEYHAHLEFLEDVGRRLEINNIDENDAAARARAMAQVSYATAVPVILSKGAINTSVDMSDVALGKDKNGRPQITLTLHRSGNGQGSALIDVDYIAGDGTSTKVASRRIIPIYREIDIRHHQFILEGADTAALKAGGTLNVNLYGRDVSKDKPIKTVSIKIP